MRSLPVSRPAAALVCVGAMAWSCATFAEIYKWVDQNGVTNYSGTPPATGKAQMLDPGKATVSVYQATMPQDAARLDALMRQKVAMLENQLQAERMARQAQQASYRADAAQAFDQCPGERRIDCDGARATPYFYTAAPVFVVGRSFLSAPLPVTVVTPFPRRPQPAFGALVRFPQPAFVPARTSGHRGSPRKF